MDITPRDVGWIEVITGCMFSGKTEELIRRVRRAMYARQRVVVFKPRIDDRYADRSIGSHSGQRLRSIRIDRARQIPRFVRDAQVVGIDEAQFMGPELVDICEALANEGRRVIVAGLDMDFRGVPFEPIPQLLAVSEYITKNLAICTVCGNPADRSQRLVEGSDRVLVGATDLYEARCRAHWSPDPFAARQQQLPLGPNLAELVGDEDVAPPPP
ncbi:MAG: thymidine kinase [Alphaproteobacteria bacterium]|nr:thymidine kinase [Alphaproteobacteria bacterium]MCB9795090.1 thymidine kinase [Alphaproteobacteria bacterium]